MLVYMIRNPESIRRDSMLRSIVSEAVRLFGGQDDGMFSSASFSVACKAHFGLPSVLDGRWCADVLAGLRFVVPMPGGCHWLYRPLRAGG